MDGDEVNAVIQMFDDPLEDIVGSHIHQRLFLDPYRVGSCLVERYRADAGGGLSHDGTADLIHRPAGGKIHDRICTIFDRHPGLFELFADIGIVSRGTDVGIDLGTQSAAHCQRNTVFVGLVVMADDDGALGDTCADKLRGHSFGCSGALHLVGNDPFTGSFKLGHMKTPGLRFRLRLSKKISGGSQAVG